MPTRSLALTSAALLGLASTACTGDDTSATNTTDTPTTTLSPTTGTPDDTTGNAGTTMGGGNGTNMGTTVGADSTTMPVDDGMIMPSFDVGGGQDLGNGCGGGGPATDATLTGTVWAPNGEIPVSGALVYTSNTPPMGIPDEVYCDECEELDCSDLYTLTEPDGSFELDTISADDQYLVVRKGQFMRVTQINIAPGTAALPALQTTLPDHRDAAAGLYIPNIAVGMGSYDRIEDALGKFGLGSTSISAFQETLTPGTEPFDIWDNGGGAQGFATQGTFANLINDPTALQQYHIIFVPCSTDTYLGSLNAATIDNIRDWVAAGGRWYVADWSNEWMEHVFPDYQTLDGEPNNADGGSYDSNATVLDTGLLDWLLALPAPLKDINPLNDEIHPTLLNLPAFVTTVDNWSVIEQVHPILVDDGMGGMVDVGHKVWLEGPGGGFGVHPLTVTGEYGCGKIQFTSYHAAEFFDYVGLSPQELILIYTILEIGVCQDNHIPPPQG